MKIASAKMRPQFVYKLSAIRRDADGNEISRRETGECPNVFTNLGVDNLLANIGSRTAGVVGTGSTAPAITDTGLAAFLAGEYTNLGRGETTFVDNLDGTGYVQAIWNTVFAVGVATGNISEVGSAWLASDPNISTPLASRALVVDGGGVPTTFEVLPDEELQLTQFFRMHFATVDQVTVINVNGTDHTITWRPWCLSSFGTTFWLLGFGGFALAGSSSWVQFGESTTLVPITSTGIPVASGVGAGQDNTGQGAQGGTNVYTPGTKKRSAWMRHPTGEALNITGTHFNVQAMGSWQCKIDPPIPKSELHRYTFTMEFELDNTP